MRHFVLNYAHHRTPAPANPDAYQSPTESTATESTATESTATTATTKDPILVVIQLTGGNDYLNTVIPYADGRYHDNRAISVLKTIMLAAM